MTSQEPRRAWVAWALIAVGLGSVAYATLSRAMWPLWLGLALVALAAAALANMQD